MPKKKRIVEPMPCPDCGRVCSNRGSLAGHQYRVHGIRLTDDERRRKQNESVRRSYWKKRGLPMPQGTSASATSALQQLAFDDHSAMEQKRDHPPAHPDPAASIPVELVAYTVGKLETITERIANENDVPAKVFTRWCAEYFSKSARR